MPQYTSLDGVKGQSVLIEDRGVTTVLGAGAITVMSRNPRRLWALVQAGPELGDNIGVYMVPGNAALPPIVLVPGGSVLFNKDFLYTGEIRVIDIAAAGGLFVRAWEATVME